MAKYTYATRRQNTGLYKAVIIGTVIATGLAVGMFVRFNSVGNKIESNQAYIDQLTIENEALTNEKVDLEEGTQALESKKQSLEETLWRYEPVVVPESMK